MKTNWNKIETELEEVIYYIRLMHPNFNSDKLIDKLMCHLYDAYNVIGDLQDRTE